MPANYCLKKLPLSHNLINIPFKSMVTKGGAAIGLLVFGISAKNLGIDTTWVIAAAVLLLSTPLVLKLKED